MRCWRHGEMIGKVCMACQVEQEHRTRSVVALVALLTVVSFLLYLLTR